MIAAQYVAGSNPDGYTLLLGNADGVTIPPAVRPQMQYRVPEDFSYVARAVQNPLTLAISTKLPIQSISDFVAYAKAHPGKLSYGTSGTGGSGHLAILRLQEQAGIELLHVPYKGTAGAVSDVLGGSIDMAVSAPVGISPYGNSDKIRVIATTSPNRDSLLPDVPTLAESGFPNATMQVWFGILGPAGLPDTVMSRLTKAISDAMNDPEVKKRFAKVDLEPVPLYGKDFRQFVVDELQAYKTIAKKANVVITD
jgi:tripartite-type tricarboxylate transporter receptor subunit TctC